MGCGIIYYHSMEDEETETFARGRILVRLRKQIINC